MHVRAGDLKSTDIQLIRLTNLQLFESLSMILPKELFLEFDLETIEEHKEILSLLPSKINREGNKGFNVLNRI